MPKAQFEHYGGDRESVCPPEPVILSNISGTGIANNPETEYTWDFGDGFFRSYDVNPNPVDTVHHKYQNWISSTPMPYLIRLMAANSHDIPGNDDPLICSATYARQLMVNPQVSARFTGPTEGCSPFEAQFRSQSMGSISSYTWDFGDGTGTDVTSDPNPVHEFVNNFNRDEIRNFPVTMIARNNWCSDVWTENFRLFPQPVATYGIKDNNVSGCQPFAVTFQNTSNNGSLTGNLTYIYNFTDGTEPLELTTIQETTHTFFNALGGNLLRYPTLTTMTSWTYNDKSVQCYSQPFEQMITIFPYLKAEFTIEPFDPMLCSPLRVSLINASHGFQEYTYHLGNSDVISGTRESGIINTYHYVNPNMYEDMYYDVRLEVWNGTCRDEAIQPIRINSSPRASFRPGSPYPQQFPHPSPPIEIINEIQPPNRENLTYLWSWSEGNFDYQNNFSTSPNPSPLNLYEWGTYHITQNVVAPNGVCFDSQTVTIYLAPNSPIANFDEVMSSCAPYQVDFVNYSRYERGYLWDFGDGRTSTDREPRHTYMTPGDYTVRLTVYGLDMTDNHMEKVITVLPTPQAGFDVRSRYLYVGQPLHVNNFSVSETNDGTPYDVWYRWNFGDGTPINTEKEPVHLYQKAGTYTVTLTIGTYSEPSCSTSMTLYDIIEIENAGNIVLPNLFRPDPTGEQPDDIPDGGYKNYLFFPPILSPTASYSMKIYHRLGILLYETDDPKKGWNGYYRGNICEEGAYIYRIEGVFQNGQSFMDVGTVLILR